MQSSKIILGLIGEIAAGKTMVTTYLKEHYGAGSARFSDSLRDILKRMYLDETRNNLQILSLALRNTFGQDIISKIIHNDVEHKKNNIIIIEGMRRFDDMACFMDDEAFKIVFIKADEKIRYQRLNQRSENKDDQNKTWEEFLKESNSESELQIREIAKKANFVIDNSGTIQELHDQIDKMMRESKIE
jgi:dephospho-CoA kinase